MKINLSTVGPPPFNTRQLTPAEHTNTVNLTTGLNILIDKHIK